MKQSRRQGTTVKKLALLCVPAIFFLAAGCQSLKKPVVIGNPNPTGHTVQEVNPGKLKVFFGRYESTYITCDLEFVSMLRTSPLEGYRAISARHDYGTLYVLIREGLYLDQFQNLKRDDKIRVYGTLTSVQMITDKEPKIAIRVDE
jgi:hypothetical protein